MATKPGPIAYQRPCLPSKEYLLRCSLQSLGKLPNMQNQSKDQLRHFTTYQPSVGERKSEPSLCIPDRKIQINGMQADMVEQI